MKKYIKRILALCLVFVLLLCGVGAERETEAKTKKYQKMSVHFIDVGQGDSTLIVCGKKAMLVDAGDGNQGTKIQNYLKKHKISKLDYVIMTHPDADHIGGMPVILTKFDCGKILMPDVTNDTATYRNVESAMKYRNYKAVHPSVGDAYKLGDAKFTIVSPGKEYDDTNGNSIAFILHHGKESFLFTGDATMEAEQDMIDSGISLSADVYHVGHHGSYTATSEKLLKAVKPKYALISCGEKNSYGFPHSGTLDKLRKAKVKVFRTDEQGSIVATSTGKKLTWSCSPSKTWQPGEKTGSSDTGKDDGKTEISSDTTYVCNTNTMKFHRPDCESVTQMSAKNRLEVTCSRDRLIADGYSPCKNCKP